VHAHLACVLLALAGSAALAESTPRRTEPPDVAQLAERLRASACQVGEMSSGTAGSGWVVDPRGYLVTNWHVVESAPRVDVDHVSWPFVKLRWADGGPDAPRAALVVAHDAKADLALLRVVTGSPLPLPSLEVDDKAAVPGARVVVVGTHRGRPGAALWGSVGAFDAWFERTRLSVPFIPGYSGSPVVSQETGRVVGVVVAMIKGSLADPRNDHDRFMVSLEDLKKFLSRAMEEARPLEARLADPRYRMRVFDGFLIVEGVLAPKRQ
jgi:S1-C subfamily serine protease